jgi:HEAT repeat protein
MRPDELREDVRPGAAAAGGASGPAAVEAMVVASLAALGPPVRTIADLYERRLDYRAAVPLLIAWLPKVEHYSTKERIVRALSVPWAKPDAAPLIIDELRHAPASEDSFRWAAAHALGVVADESVIGPLIELASDRRIGRARELFVAALARMRDVRAVSTLLNLLGDADVADRATVELRRLKAGEARPLLGRLLHHRRTRIRRKAKRALERLDEPTALPPPTLTRNPMRPSVVERATSGDELRA